MTAEGVNAIADEAATLLEPDDSARDDSRSRPRGGSEWLPDTLYLWPRRETFGPEGQGQLDRRTFYLRAAWCTDDSHARAGGLEDRGVSDAITAKVESYRATVAASRTSGPEVTRLWEWLSIDLVDYEALSTAEVRGVYLDISGWILPAS